MTSNGTRQGVERVDFLTEMDIPPVLQASMDRHRAHLGDLVRSLRMAGFGDIQIESGVNAVVASYQAELMTTITALRETGA